VIWLEAGSAGQPERVFVRSAAVFRVLHYLGGVWTVLAWVGAVVPAFVRDAVYDKVARNRHRLIRRGKACLLPTPEQRERFVDWSTLVESSERRRCHPEGSGPRCEGLAAILRSLRSHQDDTRALCSHQDDGGSRKRRTADSTCSR
jgi:hypothetical protein